MRTLRYLLTPIALYTTSLLEWRTHCRAFDLLRVTAFPILAWFACHGFGSRPLVAEGIEERVCSLQFQLVDSETGNVIPGLVQIRDANGKRLVLRELLDRGLGLPEDAAIHDWFVLIKPTVIKVPQAKLTLRAFSGLETEMAETVLDLNGRSESSISLPVTRFSTSRQSGWQAANTHVHMKKTTRPETDQYLVECSQADGLDVVFVSYLERPSEHAHYSTNNYTRSELKSLSNLHTHFDHGQEHRHNFSGWEEGYGHVMLLNIPELIQPVSIGPGITEKGTDGLPMRVGIDKARGNGGRVIWCHNSWGLEDIPSWLAGRLDANNIFDGGTRGSYQHSFYRYLNIGLRAPFSTGTDWFMYDFSRVYVHSPNRLSPEEWLEHLSAGKSYITNGPLLEFSVDDQTAGGVVSLEKPGSVRIVGRAAGRVDFERLELVMNGEVIERAISQPKGSHFSAALDIEVPIEEPAWLALRTPPPSDPEHGLVEKTRLNEYGGELFSHTSAIFVDMAGLRIFKRDVAEELLAEMQRNKNFVAGRGLFANEAERARVLEVYDQAIARLTEQIGR